MLGRFIFWRLSREEQRLGAGSFEYLRHLWRTSRSSFWVFVWGRPLLEHRRQIPGAAYHVARMVATQVEDCGPCVQVTVNLALADRVSPEILRLVVARRYDDLSEDLMAVAYFAEAVARGDMAAIERWRPVVREYLNDAAFGELALAIATVRVFPTVKRALGLAKACALVDIQVEGSAAAPVKTAT